MAAAAEGLFKNVKMCTWMPECRRNFSTGVNVCHSDGIIFPVTTRVNSSYKSEPFKIFKNK